jgi:two-component system, chemotaxis family, chemotaxis protein CheY
MSNRVLSIGQCGADHAAISRVLADQFQAAVIPVDNEAQAALELRRAPVCLVLVNRIFDADGRLGLDFIRRWKEQEPHIPIMLVSNHEDAQKEARQAGAVPGFGKAALGQPAMLDRVRLYLEETNRESVDKAGGGFDHNV